MNAPWWRSLRTRLAKLEKRARAAAQPVCRVIHVAFVSPSDELAIPIPFPAGVATTGGVMLVPVCESLDEWEAAAMAAQAKLKASVREDESG